MRGDGRVGKVSQGRSAWWEQNKIQKKKERRESSKLLIVLYCIVLHRNASLYAFSSPHTWHNIITYHISYIPKQRCIKQNCITLHCTALHCTALYFVSLCGISSGTCAVREEIVASASRRSLWALSLSLSDCTMVPWKRSAALSVSSWPRDVGWIEWKGREGEGRRD